MIIMKKMKMMINRYKGLFKINRDILDDVNELGDILKSAIIVTGGMSVDPDDKTPDAIKSTGAEIVSYGTPVLPGTMFEVCNFPNCHFGKY